MVIKLILVIVTDFNIPDRFLNVKPLFYFFTTVLKRSGMVCTPAADAVEIHAVILNNAVKILTGAAFEMTDVTHVQIQDGAASSTGEMVVRGSVCIKADSSVTGYQLPDFSKL